LITGKVKVAYKEWKGQTITHLTELFGKRYYWMHDIDGTVYLAGIDDEGNPVIL
jgi:hypothetical protein